MSMENPSLNVNNERKTVERAREEKMADLRKKLEAADLKPEDERMLRQQLVQLEADKELPL